MVVYNNICGNNIHFTWKGEGRRRVSVHQLFGGRMYRFIIDLPNLRETTEMPSRSHRNMRRKEKGKLESVCVCVCVIDNVLHFQLPHLRQTAKS